MRWWKRIKWWLHVYREIGRLQGEVEMYRRLWTSADNLTKTLGAALKDCAEASQQEIAQRDAEIHRLTLRLAVATANHAPLARYVSAIRGVQVSAGLIPAVEAAKVGVYRSQDRTLIMATFRPLSEEDSAGWELLGTDEAIKELQRRTRMAMGVWN